MAHSSCLLSKLHYTCGAWQIEFLSPCLDLKIVYGQVGKNSFKCSKQRKASMWFCPIHLIPYYSATTPVWNIVDSIIVKVCLCTIMHLLHNSGKSCFDEKRQLRCHCNHSMRSANTTEPTLEFRWFLLFCKH